jgi:hypothetical protein
MKGLVLHSISAIVLATAIAPAAFAQTQALNPAAHQMMAVSQTTPFNLAYLAYRGYLAGIPSNDRFLDEVASGRLMAKDIVAQAVTDGRVSPETLQNETYLAALQSQLQQFNRHDD